MTDRISPYITLSEYECPHCHRLPPMFDDDELPVIYTEFFDDFSFIRNAWGNPIPISSGYRCKDYNASIGGSLLSAHLYGIALDLDMNNIVKVSELDELIEDIAPHLRRGKYTEAGTFIHIDNAYNVYPRPSRSFRQGVRWSG